MSVPVRSTIFPSSVISNSIGSAPSVKMCIRDSRYHVIEQGVLDIAVMERLVGQLAVKPAFQLIFQSKELVLIPVSYTHLPSLSARRVSFPHGTVR